MTNNNRFMRVTIFLVFAVIVIAFMVMGKKLLIPFTWAFLFALILFPFCKILEKKLPRSLASLLATLLFCVIGGIIISVLVYEASLILKSEASLHDRIKIAYENASKIFYETFGFRLDDPSANTSSFHGVLGFVATEISMIGQNVFALSVIPMYLFFVLNYRGLVKKFINANYQGDQLAEVTGFIRRAQASIQSYLIGTLLLTGFTVVLSFVILLLFGIRHAFFFAVFIAVLNLLPYIGNLIAFLVVLLFVWVTKESGYTAIFVGISMYVSNLVQENFLRPKLVGDKMEMNAGMVFTAVILGGMIWGFSGMVLFIPLMGILKALLVSHNEWKPYAIFFKPG